MTIVFPIYIYNNTDSSYNLEQVNRQIPARSYFSIKNEKELLNIYLTNKDFKQKLLDEELLVVKNNSNAVPDTLDVYLPEDGAKLFSVYEFVGTGGASINFEPFTSQTSVVVVHGFGYTPMVQVLDDNNEVMIPLGIIHNNLNQFTVSFSTSTSGTIIYI